MRITTYSAAVLMALAAQAGSTIEVTPWNHIERSSLFYRVTGTQKGNRAVSAAKLKREAKKRKNLRKRGK